MKWIPIFLSAVVGFAQTAPSRDTIARGEKIFNESCAIGYCHGKGGTTGRGPSMVGRKLDRSHVETVIREGHPGTGMPAWEGTLTPGDLTAVTDYLMSLGAGKVETAAAAPGKFAGPPAAGRGATLFFENQATACGTCHAIGGRGNAVGPDLSRLARLSPKGIVVAIKATRTMYVQEVGLKGSGNFPGMPLADTPNVIKYYDMSKTPPELREVQRSQIDSVKDNSRWKHPASALNLTDEQLADIISFIRWSTYGDTKGITAADLE